MDDNQRMAAQAAAHAFAQSNVAKAIAMFGSRTTAAVKPVPPAAAVVPTTPMRDEKAEAAERTRLEREIRETRADLESAQAVVKTAETKATWRRVVNPINGKSTKASDDDAGKQDHGSPWARVVKRMNGNCR